MRMLVLFALLGVVSGFLGTVMRPRVGSSAIKMVDAALREVEYSSLVISGFLKSETGFAESFIFDVAHSTQKYEEIIAVADDVAFARKRIVSPKAVYSGLIDVLQYVEADGSESSMAEAVKGKEAWLAFNVSTANLPAYASVAAKAGCKRAVFGVYMDAQERGEGVTLADAAKTLGDAGVDYTIIKFGDVRKMAEAKYPYRLVRANATLPEEEGMLSSGDLMRVLVEIVDLPKTFNSVYGMGKGNNIDSEIQVYMKAQGWPERIQVGLLVGDMMERIQDKYAEEIKARADAKAKRGQKKNKPKANFSGFI